MNWMTTERLIFTLVAIVVLFTLLTFIGPPGAPEMLLFWLLVLGAVGWWARGRSKARKSSG